MPELPEVETMVRGLRPAMEGRRLSSVEALDQPMLVGVTVAELSKLAGDQRVVSVTRRGKWVVLALAPSGGFIVIQPRMTGGFFLREPEHPRHIRLILRLGGRSWPRVVWFCDTRRLGKIAWHPTSSDAEAAFNRSHGPDALEIGPAELSRRLKANSRGTKAALLDQKIVAGIGNIYADEILHHAGIHPEAVASCLESAEIKRIHRAIGQVLAQAIEAEGSSFDAGYRTVLGLEGGFLARNAVHRRRGEPCPRCGQEIVKTKIAGLIGRPTYYCPGCQVRPGL
jgi:formamidopyrimidine-DNA glycosylase